MFWGRSLPLKLFSAVALVYFFFSLFWPFAVAVYSLVLFHLLLLYFLHSEQCTMPSVWNALNHINHLRLNRPTFCLPFCHKNLILICVWLPKPFACTYFGACVVRKTLQKVSFKPNLAYKNKLIRMKHDNDFWFSKLFDTIAFNIFQLPFVILIVSRVE